MRGLRIFSNRHFPAKLKTQLIASFLVIMLLIISIISLLVYSSMLSVLKKQSEESFIRQFRQSEYNISSFRDQMEKMAGVLALNKDIQYFLGDSGLTDETSRVIDAKEALLALDGILGTNPYMYSISIFCPNGEALSDSVSGSWYRRDAKDLSPFYTSALYKQVSRQLYGFLWTGSGDSSLFDISERIYPNDKPVPLISVLRNVSVLGRGNLSAVMVITIKQAEFISIYNREWNTDKGAKYLIDSQGKMVSNADLSQIGSSVLFAGLVNKTTNGSFAFNGSGRSKQITYYHVGNTGWTLISETPEAEFKRNIAFLRRLIVYVILLSITLALLLSFYWIYRITRPFSHLVDAMRKMERGNLGITLDETPSNELGFIGFQFNRMSRSIEELMGQNKVIEEDKRLLELEALQAQINPHFLYNALNTIKWVAMVKKESSIVEGITTLGKMLRSIYSERALMMTLEHEVDYIRNYLKIMNARYGEGVQVSICIPDGLLHCKMIRFILQPIVENAFVHGMNAKSYQGRITISASQIGEDIRIVVSDDGAGISSDRLAEIRMRLAESSAFGVGSNGSIGLVNVNRRLAMQYGTRYGLTINSVVDEGTDVSFSLPLMA